MSAAEQPYPDIPHTLLPAFTCPECGGALVGDGCFQPLHCESIEPPEDAEADSGPWYCDFTDEEPEE